MSEWFNDTSVKMLTGADFDDKEPWKLKSKRCGFVLFFADWCGHCQNFKPEYIKFGDTAQFLRTCAVDSEKESSFMNKLKNSNSPFKIQGFPTVWIYKDGLPIEEYNGERSVKAMIKKGMEVCGTDCRCDKKKKIKKRK